jgi:hypothetical protein
MPNFNRSYIKTSKELLEIAKEVFSWFKGDSSDSLRIDCMNNIGTYTTTVNVPSFLSKIGYERTQRIKRIDPQKVYDVKVYGIKPYGGRILDAVTRDENSILLDLNKLVKYDQFRCEIKCLMNQDFFEGLIKSRSSPEPLETATRYNLTAQLIDPDSLIKGFSDVEIEEYPVYVDVYMKEHINTNIAPFLKKLSSTEAELLQEMDGRSYRKTMRLKGEQIRLIKVGGKKDITDWLNDIRQFLQPSHFLHYIDRTMSRDFHVHQCEWGDLFQALGLVPLPEKMRVTNRTDLTVDEPAKSGAIIYKSQDFAHEFKEIFNKKDKKNKH